MPAPPEHNPKKTENRLPGCLQCTCVNISVCCSHIIFFTESSFWKKDSVFSQCGETFVGPYILNLWGFLFIGVVVIDVYYTIVTGTSRSREKAYMFMCYNEKLEMKYKVLKVRNNELLLEIYMKKDWFKYWLLPFKIYFIYKVRCFLARWI